MFREPIGRGSFAPEFFWTPADALGGTLDQVNHIFASVLRLPPDSISDTTSPENTPKWDSLQSINLVLALEEEFGVTLGTRDIAEMKNVGLVRSVLRRKGAMT